MFERMELEETTRVLKSSPPGQNWKTIAKASDKWPLFKYFHCPFHYQTTLSVRKYCYWQKSTCLFSLIHEWRTWQSLGISIQQDVANVLRPCFYQVGKYLLHFHLRCTYPHMVTIPLQYSMYDEIWGDLSPHYPRLGYVCHVFAGTDRNLNNNYYWQEVFVSLGHIHSP